MLLKYLGLYCNNFIEQYIILEVFIDELFINVEDVLFNMLS